MTALEPAWTSDGELLLVVVVVVVAAMLELRAAAAFGGVASSVAVAAAFVAGVACACAGSESLAGLRLRRCGLLSMSTVVADGGGGGGGGGGDDVVAAGACAGVVVGDCGDAGGIDSDGGDEKTGCWLGLGLGESVA